MHCAPNTSSRITARASARNGGRELLRGLVRVEKDAHKSKSNVVCDALILDSKSRSDTYPYIEIEKSRRLDRPRSRAFRESAKNNCSIFKAEA